MVVRVYFPSVGQPPHDYKQVSIAGDRDTKVYSEGSVTIQDYGVHIKTDGEEYILPWATVKQVRLERE